MKAGEIILVHDQDGRQVLERLKNAELENDAAKREIKASCEASSHSLCCLVFIAMAMIGNILYQHRSCYPLRTGSVLSTFFPVLVALCTASTLPSICSIRMLLS